jgi:MFS family permease
MLDLALFGRPDFLGAVAAMVGYAAAAQVLMFFLPLYLQNAFGLTPLSCGAAMLPFAIPLFVVPRIAARMSVRHGSRVVLTWGLVLVAVGDLLLAWAAPLLRYPLFAVAMGLTGIGAGALNGETVQALQGTIPPERGGMAGGLGATVRFTAILLAVALLGAVLSHTATIDFTRRAGQLALSVDAAPLVRRVIAGDSTGALLAVPPPARVATAEIAHLSVASGVAWLMFAAALVAAASSALAWRLLPERTAVSRPGLKPLIVAD